MRIENWLRSERPRDCRSCLRRLERRQAGLGFESDEVVVAVDQAEAQDAVRMKMDGEEIRRKGEGMRIGCLGSCLGRKPDWPWGPRGSH